MPPKEPWAYGKEFNDYFRKVVEMKYKLMPYIYAQSKASTENGLPMLRALFIEYPGDAGAWTVDNEYLFGSDILVAPLFDNSGERDVYLPGGSWVDFQTGKQYPAGWNRIKCGEIEAIILVKEGACIPMVKVAQSTSMIDWNNIELVVYGKAGEKTSTTVCLPSDNIIKTIEIQAKDNKYSMISNPFSENIKFKISHFGN
jgi:alpha-D-xyloside xylohydrolase